MDGGTQWLECAIHEDMIDGQRGKPRREGANGSRWLNEFAHISEMAVKCAIWSRTAHTVEVTEQNNRNVTGNGCPPLGAGIQLCLQSAFAPAETEMRVDDVDLPRSVSISTSIAARFSGQKKRWSAW